MTAERPAAKPMKSLDDALAQLLGYAAPLDGVEQLATFDADGRVLLAVRRQGPAEREPDGHHVRQLFVDINTLTALQGLPAPDQASR